MRRKKSILWTIPKEELENIIKTSSSYKKVLIRLGFAVKSGGNYRTLKQRLEQDKIDVSHIEAAKKTFRGSRAIKISVEKLLTKDSKHCNSTIKKAVLESGLLENKCSKCGIGTTWCGEFIALQMDHINGDHDDNRIENLRILCPNCHSQTKTWGKRNSYEKKQTYLCACGNEKTRQAKYCLVCASKRPHKTKIDWPSDKELVKRSSNQSLLSLSKELGVSDNAIRKRLRKLSE